MSTPQKRLTKSQRGSLRWAKSKYTDGRVPPHVFRDYRSIPILIKAGFIEYWREYGAPMYRFTDKGLEALGLSETKTADAQREPLQNTPESTQRGETPGNGQKK